MLAFSMIDKNNSSTIDYNELNFYYNLFNQLYGSEWIALIVLI